MDISCSPRDLCATINGPLTSLRFKARHSPSLWAGSKNNGAPWNSGPESDVPR